MDFKDMKFCQSCMMPLSEGMYGTEKDGSESEDYCKFCYQEGEFTNDMTLEEMIDFCVPKTAKAKGISEMEARKMSEELYPKLKRWMR